MARDARAAFFALALLLDERGLIASADVRKMLDAGAAALKETGRTGAAELVEALIGDFP